ncbi:MAG: MMPL family transporter [Solirubrobacterales bacterium]
MADQTNETRGIAARMGRWSASHRKTAIIGWLVFVVLAVGIGGTVGTRQLTDSEDGAGESGRADAALADSGLEEVVETVLVQSNGAQTFEDPEFQAAVTDVADRVSRVDGIANVVTPLDGDAPISEDRRAALVQFEIEGDPDDAATTVEPAIAAVAAANDAHPNLRIEEFGAASAEVALGEVFEEDLRRAEFLSLPITLIILVIAFGALVAAGVPLLVGITAVAATIGLVALPSQLFPVDEAIASVILLIGLAVGVDYSLFYLQRVREERAKGRDSRSALAVASATSGRAILISGLTVMVAMAGMFLTGSATFASFGVGTIMVVAVAMIASLTVLPAVLAWLGDRVEKGRIPFTGRMRGPERSGMWSAIVDRVLRRPALSALVAGAFLIALAIPAIGMKTETGSVEALPQDLEVVQTYERITASFPAEGNEAVVVVSGDDLRSAGVPGAVDSLRNQARGSESIVGPAEVEYSASGNEAAITVPIAGEGTDDASSLALDELRGVAVPAAFAGTSGLEVNVSGWTAQSDDFNDLVASRLPFVFAFVLGFAFLLMLFTFRSIVVPIKAIALNLLSVAAAYGVLVLVFQHGLGESLLGFESTGAIASWLPLFLFVVLFGLSMDYHVFILSRVREAVDRGMGTEAAVRVGIRTTAGVVTSAAMVMVAVFAIFATLTFIEMKQMGVGLAVAVLIDATIIRAVLLPATMKLLGERNWYLPSWLEWLPRVSHEVSVPDAVGPADSEPTEGGSSETDGERSSDRSPRKDKGTRKPATGPAGA